MAETSSRTQQQQQHHRQQPRSSQGGAGSTTQTQVQTQTNGVGSSPRVLRLRGRHPGSGNGTGRSVQWADDVVDNEGLGRKSSKVCCIYHRPKGVDESSDESSSSSDDSDSSSGEDSDHEHGVGKCAHGRDVMNRQAKRRAAARKRPSPNAYEKVPKQRLPKSDDTKPS